MSISPIAVPSHGPRDASIFLLAEAPGDRETERGQPLVGPSGWELRRMLKIIGVSLDDCYKTNVLSRQPEDNLLGHYCSDDPARQLRHLGPLTSNPLGYMDLAHSGELERLRDEISEVSPNIIIALGNTATWALGLGTGINALRGSVHTSTVRDRTFKVLPTYHPAAVLRDWSLRTIAIADLQKAANESLTPTLQFDNTELWLNPSLSDIADFDRLHMEQARVCACDIETKRSQITCISFAPTVDVSLAIPFWVDGQSPNYWPDAASEFQAWAYVRHWLERGDLVKVGQNFLYDLQYLQSICNPQSCTEDTMLAHHSLYSELQKGLGFLGSVYAHTPSWKSMRTAKREDILKRDD